MCFAGIDLHERTRFVTVIDEVGNSVQGPCFFGMAEGIPAFPGRLPGPTRIVIESSSSWYRLYDVPDGCPLLGGDLPSFSGGRVLNKAPGVIPLRALPRP